MIVDVYPGCDESTLEYLLELAESALNVFVLVIDDALTSPAFSSMLRLIRLMIEDRDSRNFCTCGRPRICMERHQLEFLVDQGFRICDIASMFKCSRRTVERRVNEYGLSINRWSLICDGDLDRIVKDITTLFPQCGEKSVNGRLRARGIHVQRERDFMRMEVWEKEIVTVSLHRPPAYVQEEAFGLTLLPVYADEEGDVLLSANVKSIATGSTAQLQGVTVGDEVIMVNDVALFEINWSGLQGLMTGPTVTLTVRTKKAALKQLKSRRGSIYRARRQSQDFLKDMNQDVLKAFLEPKGDETVEEEEGTSSTSLSPQKMKAVVKVEKTIADLIQSERSNLKHLDSIMQIYYQPLQRAGVGHDEVNAIFGGIVSTIDFQRTLLADFEEVQESVHCPEYAQQPSLKKAEHLCLGVTAAFNRHGERFKTFSMFCTCHCRLQNIISTDSGVLRQVLASCVPANQLSLKLETMFTKPIQRVLQYPLYLHVLEKQVPHTGQWLISRMDVVVNYINEMQRISDNFTLLFDSLLRDVGQWKLSQSVSVQCLRFRGVFQWLNPNDEVPNKGWKKGQGPDIECFVFRALVLLFIIEKKKKRTSRASLNSVSSSSNGVSLDDVKFRTVLLCSTCVARDLPDSDGVNNMWQLFSALIGSNKVCTFILRCRSKEQKSQVLSIFK
nr:T-lymphoma invasion and metastasis-inducing protein 1A [Halisarca dujardinii]